MKLIIFIFCFLIVILSPHGLFSKSITNKEDSNDSANFNEKTDVDRLGNDETAALHDSYRPRHKYKGVTGHQSRMYRSDAEFDREQEIRNPQCAVMYKNNEPVGILQPFEDSYRFLPLNGEPTLVDINPIPVKRKTIMDVLYPSKISDDYDDESFDNNDQFADDRYPSIFAKFKIDSRLDKSLNPDVTMKRPMYKRKSEKSDLKEDQVGSLKSTLTKMKSDDSVAVEEELKNILDDMGLIDDYPEKEEAKREAEDENLELGTNKINLLKEEHKEKREEEPSSLISTDATSRKSFTHAATTITTIAIPKDVQFLDKQTEEGERIDLFNQNEEAKLEDDSENIDSEVSTEKTLDTRKKRQDLTDNVKEEDKHKRGLEMNNLSDNTTPNLAEEGELNEYEKRVEREIRDKIEKLKDEVKKEINDLKQTDDDKSKKVTVSVADPKRRKRQVVNTLMDEETADIDPTLNIDGQIVRHVRRKKSVDLKNYSSRMDNNIANNITKLGDSEININGLNTNNHKVAIKRFIGLNPILENVNCTKYHTRALKQYNVDPNKENVENKPHIRVKRQEIDNDIIRISGLLENQTANSTILRKKRQTEDEMEDNAYQYDDSQFNEEMPYDNLNKQNTNDNGNADADRVENSQYVGNSKTSCNCDKNGNNCKCGKQNIDTNLPTFKQYFSDYNIINPSNSLEKKSVDQTHCNCGKNENHCKCGHFIEDTAQPLNHDDSDYIDDQSNGIQKKSPNLNDKKTLNDKELLNDKDSPNDKESLNDKEFLNDRASLSEKESLNFLSDKEALNDKESLRDKESLSDYQFDSKFRRKNIFEPSERDGYMPSKEADRQAEAEYDYYETEENNLAKREAKPRRLSANDPFQNGEYFVDLHPDVYRLSPVDNSRDKRENFNQLVAIHSGGPVRSHLVAIKQRSMMPHTRFRRRVQNDDNRELRQLIDMSDEELFGALPQSFEGELARYKRVKRAKAKK